MDNFQTLEKLPNEIFQDLFEYFDIYELYKIFSKLNFRFDGLVKNFQHLQIILHSFDDIHYPVNRYFLSTIKTLVIDHSKKFYDSTIIESISHIRCLILGEPTREQWESISPLYFPHLERLYLFNTRFAYRTEKLCQLIFSNAFSSLHSCSLPHITYELSNSWTQSYHLQSLQVNIWDIRVYTQILHTCPNLRHLTIRLSCETHSENVSLNSNLRHLNLQYLNLHRCKPITDGFIDSILSFVPNLSRFSLRANNHYPSSISMNTLVDIFQKRIPRLRRINIDITVQDSMFYEEQMETKYPLFQSVKLQTDLYRRTSIIIRGSIW
ncbi:hypothetical protein I4U23_001224 [Adineta vaga]|nr:hypothetical protein I4U23_001224 [Adineta vaga]